MPRAAEVRAVDIKPVDDWYQVLEDAENLVLDLQLAENCEQAVDGGMTDVYNLAADMGGMGFIENNKAAVHALGADQHPPADVARRSSASSASSTPRRPASTPPTSRQDTDVAGLKESDAYPAMPEDGYGWEKLFSERMCRHFREDFGLETRVARYHNVYGPHGTWDGGREKAPAAICRKVDRGRSSPATTRSRSGATASRPAASCTSTTASRGRCGSMDSDVVEPLNLGSDELVTINELVDIVEDDRRRSTLERRYDLDAPQGVRGRNSDNTLIRERLGWAPSISLARRARADLPLDPRPGCRHRAMI